MKRSIIFFIVINFLLLSACSDTDVGNTTSSSQTTTTTHSTFTPTFYSLDIDWLSYETSEKLINAVDGVFTGKIIDISFEIWDRQSNRPMTDETPMEKRQLQTIYHIAVTDTYKGNYTGTVKLVCQGGRQDYQVEKQKNLCVGAGINMFWLPYPGMTIGEARLFTVAEKENFVSPISAYQGFFTLDDPFEKQCGISCKEMLTHFGQDKWDTFWAAWKTEHPLWESELTGDSLKQAKAEK